MTAAPPPAPPAEPPNWAPPPPPSPPAGPPARTHLRRSHTDKMVGGVCGGLAEYSGIDPLLWRVGFVALAFAGGSGVLVYLLLWLLMPSAPPGPDDQYPAWQRAPRAPRARRQAGPRSPVPGITVAGLLIVLGVLAFLARFTGWDARPRDFLGAALLIVGLGLIAAAFSGGRRSRGGLIALGIVLSLALVSTSTALHWRGGKAVGDLNYNALTAADVQPTYSGAVGDMTVNLSGVDLNGASVPIRTRIEHGVGDVKVMVPESADVRVTVDNGLGTVRLFRGSSSTNGVYLGDGSEPWAGDGNPEFVISIGTGVGDVEVSRG